MQNFEPPPQKCTTDCYRRTMASGSQTREASCQRSEASTFDEELEGLTANFKGQCKVINYRDKGKTVKLHPENLDIVFNFKITDTYPVTGPVVDIRSESLEEQEIFELKDYLRQVASNSESNSIAVLVDMGLKWLKDRDIDVTGNRKKQNHNTKDRSNKGKQRRSRRKPQEETEKGKKPPMKTAIDVVKRILWDGALQQDQFLVGYMDRMDGLKEKYFNAFSWEDIASVDYTVLAIPKHRIQYFKYKNEIVWDKRCRLDNVFGSTGSKTTITDVVARVDGVAVRNENNEYENNVHDLHVPDVAEPEVDSDYYDSAEYSESDSDSDDGIIVTIGNQLDASAAYKPEYGDDVDATPDLEEENGDQFDKYWRDKLRPNHFLALRITDDEIRNTVEEIQKQVVENEPKLKDCKIPRGALHLTLATVGLESPEQIQNAVECLEEALPELASILPKDKKLTFKGVETFFNRVIYGRVVECPPELLELVEHLKICLTAKGIEIRDYHEFVPHMTIMKVSRPVAKMTGNNYIAPWLYSSFNSTVLGHQSVDNLHLCSMVDERREDGFYITAASFKL